MTREVYSGKHDLFLTPNPKPTQKKNILYLYVKTTTTLYELIINDKWNTFLTYFLWSVILYIHSLPQSLFSQLPWLRLGIISQWKVTYLLLLICEP